MAVAITTRFPVFYTSTFVLLLRRKARAIISRHVIKWIVCVVGLRYNALGCRRPREVARLFSVAFGIVCVSSWTSCFSSLFCFFIGLRRLAVTIASVIDSSESEVYLDVVFFCFCLTACVSQLVIKRRQTCYPLI